MSILALWQAGQGVGTLPHINTAALAFQAGWFCPCELQLNGGGKCRANQWKPLEIMGCLGCTGEWPHTKIKHFQGATKSFTSHFGVFLVPHVAVQPCVHWDFHYTSFISLTAETQHGKWTLQCSNRCNGFGLFIQFWPLKTKSAMELYHQSRSWGPLESLW